MAEVDFPAAVTRTGDPVVEFCVGLQIVTEGRVVVETAQVVEGGGGAVVVPKKSLINGALAAAPGTLVVTPTAASIVRKRL